MFWAREADRAIHISEITRENTGLMCRCTCRHCGEYIIANKKTNLNNEFVERFSHQGDKECRNQKLHTAAIKIILHHSTISLPDHHSHEYQTAIEEYTLPGTRFSADVYLTGGSKDLAVEIWVKHKTESNKVSYYQKVAFQSIEIYIDPKEFTIEDKIDKATKAKLEKAVLQEFSNREWLSDPPVIIKPNMAADTDIEKILKGLLALAIFLIGKKIIEYFSTFFRPPSNHKNKRRQGKTGRYRIRS